MYRVVIRANGQTADVSDQSIHAAVFKAHQLLCRFKGLQPFEVEGLWLRAHAIGFDMLDPALGWSHFGWDNADRTMSIEITRKENTND